MKIFGPYSDSTGKRQIVIKQDDTGIKKTMSYARFLMEQYLHRELTKDETVDHINGDSLDNDLKNLQILSLADNVRKSAKPVEIYKFDCPICKIPTEKEAAVVRHNRKQGKAGPFCSKKCSRQYQLRSSDGN